MGGGFGKKRKARTDVAEAVERKAEEETSRMPLILRVVLFVAIALTVVTVFAIPLFAFLGTSDEAPVDLPAELPVIDVAECDTSTPTLSLCGGSTRATFVVGVYA